jgi:hypothetical protein
MTHAALGVVNFPDRCTRCTANMLAAACFAQHMRAVVTVTSHDNCLLECMLWSFKALMEALCCRYGPLCVTFNVLSEDNCGLGADCVAVNFPKRTRCTANVLAAVCFARRMRAVACRVSSGSQPPATRVLC